MTPAELALAEYTRRKEAAVITVANHPGQRARVETNLRAWLAIVLLTGATHPDAAEAMAPYLSGSSWTDNQIRAAAASWLCPHRSWAPHLSHELDRAVAAAAALAEGEPQSRATTDPAPTINRARALLALSRLLHNTPANSPFPPAGRAGEGPVSQQTERKAA